MNEDDLEKNKKKRRSFPRLLLISIGFMLGKHDESLSIFITMSRRRNNVCMWELFMHDVFPPFLSYPKHLLCHQTSKHSYNAMHSFLWI